MPSAMTVTQKATIARKEMITAQAKATAANSSGGNNTTGTATTGGPTTTVFVGNISEKASDQLVRQLLSVRKVPYKIFSVPRVVFAT